MYFKHKLLCIMHKTKERSRNAGTFLGTKQTKSLFFLNHRYAPYEACVEGVGKWGEKGCEE